MSKTLDNHENNLENIVVAILFLSSLVNFHKQSKV